MNRTNANCLSSIVITLDSHNKEHIAHGYFWRDEDGSEPPPFTQILSSEVGTRWWPKDPSLLSHAKEYTAALERKGRFTLIIWPQHCIMGTNGQAVGNEIFLLSFSDDNFHGFVFQFPRFEKPPTSSCTRRCRLSRASCPLRKE